MHQWTKSRSGTATFSFLLFDRFSNQVLSNALEPLRAANTFLGREAYRWRLVTQTGAPVASSAGMQVVPETGLSNLAEGAALVMLPSYGYRSAASAETLRWLRGAPRRFDALIGIDSGAWTLAAAGLLNGRPATIHLDAFDDFSEAFPAVEARRDRWIDDGDILTAGGAVAAFELLMHLIGRDHGLALTRRIASLFAVPDAVPAAAPPSSRDRRIARALATMEANVETPLAMPEIARAAGTAQKDLERRFLKALGAPPRKVYQRIRLDAARNLVENSGLDIAEIAARAGYHSAASFTRAFRATFGATPRSLRRD